MIATAATRSPAAAGRVQDHAEKALIAGLTATGECDRESSHEWAVFCVRAGRAPVHAGARVRGDHRRVLLCTESGSESAAYEKLHEWV